MLACVLTSFYSHASCPDAPGTTLIRVQLPSLGYNNAFFQVLTQTFLRRATLSIKLLKSTLTVGSMTLLSRVFGLIRDVTLANVFGVTGGTDAFLVAFKIPNFMRRLFAEGAFSQAFVPVFSEYKETRSREALRDLVDHVAGTLGTVLLLIATLGSVAAPLLVYLFAPGFSGDSARHDLTAEMLRITFPYLFFISLVAFCGGILNSYNRFDHSQPVPDHGCNMAVTDVRAAADGAGLGRGCRRRTATAAAVPFFTEIETVPDTTHKAPPRRRQQDPAVDAARRNRLLGDADQPESLLS
jgi:hypothetical protein